MQVSKVFDSQRCRAQTVTEQAIDLRAYTQLQVFILNNQIGNILAIVFGQETSNW